MSDLNYDLEKFAEALQKEATYEKQKFYPHHGNPYTEEANRAYNKLQDYIRKHPEEGKKIEEIMKDIKYNICGR